MLGLRSSVSRRPVIDPCAFLFSSHVDHCTHHVDPQAPKVSNHQTNQPSPRFILDWFVCVTISEVESLKTEKKDSKSIEKIH